MLLQICSSWNLSVHSRSLKGALSVCLESVLRTFFTSAFSLFVLGLRILNLKIPDLQKEISFHCRIDRLFPQGFLHPYTVAYYLWQVWIWVLFFPVFLIDLNVFENIYLDWKCVVQFIIQFSNDCRLKFKTGILINHTRTLKEFHFFYFLSTSEH